MGTRENAATAADGLCRQVREHLAGAHAAGVREAQAESSAVRSLMATIAANVDNTALSDEEFRQFVRNSLPVVAA